MILRTIKCSIKGCAESLTEQTYGAGFPAWGILQGPRDGKIELHFCSAHLKRVFDSTERIADEDLEERICKDQEIDEAQNQDLTPPETVAKVVKI